MTDYFRPIAETGLVRPADAVPLAGGPVWFALAEHLTRAGSRGLVPARDLPGDVLDRLTARRAPLAGLALDRPRLMGILNVTPDSFSDGGQFATRDTALAQARRLVGEGADILDIGGESTRPGADFVPAADEIARTVPLIETLAPEIGAPISIDTRKAEVGRAALAAGARMLNDVSAMTFDPAMPPLAAETGVPACLMHTRGDPKTMQDDPRYDDVLLDVCDYLAARVAAAEAAGVARDRIIVDPGIGFGKTVAHNLALIRGLSLFHGLGCAMLLGASRKRFIGTLADAPDAQARLPGSLAVALAGAAQGVQILRVHDMQATRQALTLWRAVQGHEGGQ